MVLNFHGEKIFMCKILNLYYIKLKCKGSFFIVILSPIEKVISLTNNTYKFCNFLYFYIIILVLMKQF